MNGFFAREDGRPEIPAFSDDDLRRFCEFLYQRTGISYSETKRIYIERRLFDRMEQVGTQSFAAYMGLIRAGGPEAEQVINSFTVNETYFYREEHQLRCLSRAMLPELIA